MSAPPHLPHRLLFVAAVVTFLAGLLWSGVASGALRTITSQLGESANLTDIALRVLQVIFWSGMVASALFAAWIILQGLNKNRR